MGYFEIEQDPNPNQQRNAGIGLVVIGVAFVILMAVILVFGNG